MSDNVLANDNLLVIVTVHFFSSWFLTLPGVTSPQLIMNLYVGSLGKGAPALAGNSYTTTFLGVGGPELVRGTLLSSYRSLTHTIWMTTKESNKSFVHGCENSHQDHLSFLS